METAKTVAKLGDLTNRPEQAPTAVAVNTPELPVKEIMAAVDDATGENGWANLGEVGSILNKKRPDFDPRNYGFKKLSDLVAQVGDLEMKTGGGQTRLIRRKS